MSGAEPCTGSKMPGPLSPRLAEAARPSPPVTAAATSREDVAERVLGHDDVDAVGDDDELHREAVDERVAQLDVRVLGRDLVDDPPPEPRGVEHVRLVDRDERAARAPRELERAPRDALDLRRVVLAGVEDGAVLANAARPEVEAADELAHDHQVDSPCRAGRRFA